MSGERAGRWRGPFRRAGRRTNVALRWLLIAAFLTGWVAFATARGVPAVLGAGLHGLFGLSVVVLAPWKYVIVRRAQGIRPMGWLLLVVALICLGSGFLQLFAGYVVVFGLSPIQLHVGSTLVGVMVLIWHTSTTANSGYERSICPGGGCCRPGPGWSVRAPAWCC